MVVGSKEVTRLSTSVPERKPRLSFRISLPVSALSHSMIDEGSANRWVFCTITSSRSLSLYELGTVTPCFAGLEGDFPKGKWCIKEKKDSEYLCSPKRFEAVLFAKHHEFSWCGSALQMEIWMNRED